MGDVTQLLAEWGRGDRAALDSLTSVVYGELRKIADGYLRRERSDHTLQPTALVHEAWMRLTKQDESNFDNRKQFFALAAQIMRRILVDHGRSVQAEKRGGGAPTIQLGEAQAIGTSGVEEFLALDEALERLAKVSARKAQIVEMRYFGGLEGKEIAELLGISAATVSREQKTAEAWLSQAMSGEN
ncbi:MAG: sigma-70 family RNA polymerase sigma factor [Acidobacteriota bacterium]